MPAGLRLESTERMDIEQRNALVEQWLPLVRVIARQFPDTGPPMEYADYVQAGNVGLLDAASRYQPSRARFDTYARPRIRGAIADYIRGNTWGRRGSPYLPGVREEECWTLRTAPEDRPDTLAEAAEQRARVASALRALPGRERIAVERYYFDDAGLIETGKTLGVSYGRASQMLTSARKRMEPALRLAA